jgi:hypothetical protein
MAPFRVFLLALVGALSLPLSAQDLYDTTTLRTFALTFPSANFIQQMRDNYASQTPIPATLVVDGVTYPNVGVRIRGNTSYSAVVAAGSQKFSFKIDMDFIDPNQDLMSYDSINLNNAYRDPTFSREVLYNNFVARFMPHPRSNNVLLTLNGQNWGVYANVQQPDKRMLRDHFANPDGLRIRCENNPNGPGLTYAGTNPASYNGYEIQEPGGLANPLQALIDVTNAVTNFPTNNPTAIDALFAIDPSSWSVVFENLLTDDDSYLNKGCDFMTYRDPVDGRMHLLQRDANEAFTASTWTVLRNFTATNKPVLSRVLSNPATRQRFYSHYRVALRDLTLAYFNPQFDAQQALLNQAVIDDPKKLYTHAQFVSNFTSAVTFTGGTVPGLRQFVTDRGNFLRGGSNVELNAPGPTITEVRPSSNRPRPSDTVHISARVAPVAPASVGSVALFVRATAALQFSELPMRDDGLSGDGAAGDGVYGAALPFTAAPGQRVQYYVGAVSTNTYLSASYSPELSELDPLTLEFAVSQADGMRITEWMYSGGVGGGEFVEFTNLSANPIDLTGWTYNDSAAVAAGFSLSPFGVVAPGESVVLTEVNDATFRTIWSLAPSVKVIGSLGAVSGNNLGRNDQINLYDAGGGLIDRLTYGDENLPGTIRTQLRSGQAGCAALGLNTVNAWQLSSVGDAYGSVNSSAGETGAPGRYPLPNCPRDALFANGFEN